MAQEGGVAPYTCEAKGASPPDSATAGESCRYFWAVEGDNLTPFSNTLGFCFKHLTHERFIYRHRWQAGMVLMWDNRCTMHLAEGGYDGHLRLMHRTTVAGDRPV